MRAMHQAIGEGDKVKVTLRFMAANCRTSSWA